MEILGKILPIENPELEREPVIQPCQHVPSETFASVHVGKTTTCKLCGVVLTYSNSAPRSRVRMSKKERKAERKVHAHD